MNMNLKPFFTSKKIVYTKQWQPGLLLYTFVNKGKWYARIAFPNRKKFEDKMPITDVLFEDVKYIRKLPTPFATWFFGLFGMKAKAKTFIINR